MVNDILVTTYFFISTYFHDFFQVWWQPLLINVANEKPKACGEVYIKDDVENELDQSQRVLYSISLVKVLNDPVQSKYSKEF